MSGTINGSMITIRQGDSYVLNLELTKDCKPLDVTGFSCVMQVRTEDDDDLITSVEAVPVDAAHGKIALMFSPENTNIELGNYVCDIQLTSNNGEVHTIWPNDVNKIGTFRITRQVTVV